MPAPPSATRAPAGTVRRSVGRALRRGAQLSFGVILWTLPVTAPVAVIERSGADIPAAFLDVPIHLSDILLVCLVLCWALEHAVAPTRAMRLPDRPLAVVVALLTGFVVLSVAWAVVPGIATPAAIRWLLRLGLVLYIVDEVRWHRPIAVWLATGATLHAAFAVARLIAPVAGSDWPSAASLSPSDNPILGPYLVIGLLAWTGLLATGRRYRAAQLTAIAITCAGLVATSAPIGGHSVVARSEMEPTALMLWRRRPLGGVGIGNGPVAASLIGLPPEDQDRAIPTGGALLHLTAELGVVGGGLWLALWALVLGGTWLGRARLGGRRPWWLVWTGAVLAAGFFGWRDPSVVTDPQGGALLWTAIGLWASAGTARIVWRVPRLPRQPRADAEERHGRPARPGRADGLAFSLVGLATGLVFIALHVLLIRPRGPLLWDPASFAAAGAEVWGAARHGDWSGAIRAAGRPDQYPPGYAVLSAGWFLLVGIGQVQARLFSLLWLGLTIVLGFWLSWWVSPSDRCGRRAGVIFAVLILSAPTLIYLGTDAVLEPVGAALTMATLTAAALAATEPGRFSQGSADPDSADPGRAAPRRSPRGLGWLAVSGALAAVTSLVKYNYGLPLVASLGLVALLDGAPPPIRRRRLAVVAATAVLPLAMWLVLEPERRLEGVIQFAVNRSSGLGFFAGLAAYIRAIGTDYAANAWIGAAVAVAAGIGLRRHGRDPRLQPAIVFAGLFLAMVLVHPYKQPRFLYTVAPVWIVLASLVVGAALERVRVSESVRGLTGRGLRLAAPALALVGIATFAALAAGGVAGRVAGYRHGDNEWLNFEPRARKVVEDIVRFVGASVDPRDGVIVNGVWNEFSVSLLAWHWRAERDVAPVRLYGLPYIGPAARSGRVAATEQAHRDALRGSLVRWRPAHVVSVTVAPASAFHTRDYAQWNAWQTTYDRSIAHEATLRRRRAASFDEGRIRVTIYCVAAESDCR